MQVFRKSVRVPQTIQEAEVAISDLARLDRDYAVRKAKDDGRIDKIRIAFAKFKDRIARRKEKLTGLLERFAKAHKHLIDTPKHRSLQVTTGVLGWRQSPGRIEIEEGRDQDVIKAIIRKGKKLKFLRIQVEIDRAALLKDEKKYKEAAFVHSLPFTKLVREDEFFVKPEELPKKPQKEA